jgi:hypothetical protein
MSFVKIYKINLFTLKSIHPSILMLCLSITAESVSLNRPQVSAALRGRLLAGGRQRHVRLAYDDGGGQDAGGQREKLHS